MYRMRFYFGKLCIKRSLNFRFRPHPLTCIPPPTLKIILAIPDILHPLLKKKNAFFDLHFIKSIDLGKNGCLKNIESFNP